MDIKLNEIFNLDLGISGNINNTIWEDFGGEYFAICYDQEPYVSIYHKIDDNNFEKLPDIDIMPTGKVNCAAFIYDNYLILGHDNYPYISIYKRNNNQFLKQPNEDELPTNNVLKIDATWQNHYILLVQDSDTQPLLFMRFANDKLTINSQPSISSKINKIKFPKYENYVAIGCESSPYLVMFKRNNTATVNLFDRLPDITEQIDEPIKDMAWSLYSEFLACISDNNIIVYKRKNEQFTKLPDIDISGLGTLKSIVFNQNSYHLIISHENYPYVTVYYRENDIFTKTSNILNVNSNLININMPFNGKYLCCISNENATYKLQMYKQQLYSSGEGTLENPYIISNAKEFYNIRFNTMSIYCQNNNIDMSEVDNWTTMYWFSGIYDGKNYEITNYELNEEISDLEFISYPSLFGIVISNIGQTTIKNVFCKNFIIKIYNEVFCGALVGMANSNTLIENCHAINCIIESFESHVGGFAGSLNCIVNNCSFSGSVKGGFNCGGFAGICSGTMRQCYSNAKIYSIDSSCGGFVANCYNSQISQCKSEGTIEQESSTAKVAGFINIFNNCSASECFATMDIICDSAYTVSGFIANCYNATITNCYSRGNIYIKNDPITVGGFIGKLFSNTNISNCYSTNNIAIKHNVDFGDYGYNYTYIGGLIGNIYGDDISQVNHCFAAVGAIEHENYPAITNENVKIGRVYGNKSGEITINNYAYDNMTFNNNIDFWTNKILTGKDGQDISLDLLKTQNTYVDENWDFNTIWQINPTYNDGFPYLKYFKDDIEIFYNFDINGVTFKVFFKYEELKRYIISLLYDNLYTILYTLEEGNVDRVSYIIQINSIISLLKRIKNTPELLKDYLINMEFKNNLLNLKGGYTITTLKYLSKINANDSWQVPELRIEPIDLTTCEVKFINRIKSRR